MTRNNYPSRNHSQFLVRPSFLNFFLLAVFFFSGCGSGEPPTVAVLQPLAQKCATSHPFLPMMSPIGWSSASKEVTVLGNPEIESPILGHFPIVGDVWQPGPRITIWPVKIAVEITYRKIDIKWSRPRTPGSQADALVHGRDSQEPNVPTFEEEVKKEKTNVLCYAFKNKEGQWELTGLKPTDDTPFYQKWWNTIGRTGS